MESDLVKSYKMQRNVIANNFMADGYSKAAAGRPRAPPNPSAVFSNRSSFQVELKEKPERDKKGPGRQTINIDENEDTLHSKADFQNILKRGKRL